VKGTLSRTVITLGAGVVVRFEGGICVVGGTGGLKNNCYITGGELNTDCQQEHHNCLQQKHETCCRSSQAQSRMEAVAVLELCITLSSVDWGPTALAPTHP
jgi:hypothetical protein